MEQIILIVCCALLLLVVGLFSAYVEMQDDRCQQRIMERASFFNEVQKEKLKKKLEQMLPLEIRVFSKMDTEAFEKRAKSLVS